MGMVHIYMSIIGSKTKSVWIKFNKFNLIYHASSAYSTCIHKSNSSILFCFQKEMEGIIIFVIAFSFSIHNGTAEG